jgi:hypothetical protein
MYIELCLLTRYTQVHNYFDILLSNKRSTYFSDIDYVYSMTDGVNRVVYYNGRDRELLSFKEILAINIMWIRKMENN